MTNISIKNAFERMWQHIIFLLGNKSDLVHEHSASEITTGTFPNEVMAGVQTPEAAILRNSKLVSEETTPNSEGEICWQYE